MKKKKYLVVSRGFLTKHAAIGIKKVHLIKGLKEAKIKAKLLKKEKLWKHQEVEIKKVKRGGRLAQYVEMQRFDPKMVKMGWKVGKKWKKKR